MGRDRCFTLREFNFSLVGRRLSLARTSRSEPGYYRKVQWKIVSLFTEDGTKYQCLQGGLAMRIVSNKFKPIHPTGEPNNDFKISWRFLSTQLHSDRDL